VAAVLTVGVDDDADWCAERRLLAGRRRQHDICCAQPAVASFILTVEGGPSCHGLLQMRRPLLVASAPLSCGGTTMMIIPSGVSWLPGR